MDCLGKGDAEIFSAHSSLPVKSPVRTGIQNSGLSGPRKIGAWQLGQSSCTHIRILVLQ